MREMLRSNDAVLIDFAQSVLRQAGITSFVADQHISVVEGSIGAFPRRLLVGGGRLADRAPRPARGRPRRPRSSTTGTRTRERRRAIAWPTTEDAFLGGALRILQPKDGYRAGIDAVLLAAAAPLRQGRVEQVLDVGAGVGVVGLVGGAPRRGRPRHAGRARDRSGRSLPRQRRAQWPDRARACVCRRCRQAPWRTAGAQAARRKLRPRPRQSSLPSRRAAPPRQRCRPRPPPTPCGAMVCNAGSGSWPPWRGRAARPP